MDITLKPSPTGTGITPIMPSEPPKEVKEMTFSAEPELITGGGETTITTDKGVQLTETKTEKQQGGEQKAEEKKAEEVKKEETKKEETKSVLKAPVEEKKEEKKEEQQTIAKADKLPIKTVTPVKKEEDFFDYSKYSTEQQQILKQMSNTAKKEYAKVVDENKQLAQLKDATYLQHEQGYILSPEFQEIQQKEYLARTEGDCWKQALLSIKAGKPFREITGFNPKTGQPILSEEMQPTDEDEIRITNNLSACLGVSQQLNGKLQQYPQQFKQRINQDLQTIESVRKEKFSWVADPKLLEYTVAVEGQGDKKLKDIKNDFKSMFPSYLANSPGVEVASDLMLSLIIQSAELREARNGQQIEQIKRKEEARGEPSSDKQDDQPSTLNAKGVPKTFSFDGFPSN